MLQQLKMSIKPSKSIIFLISSALSYFPWSYEVVPELEKAEVEWKQLSRVFTPQGRFVELLKEFASLHSQHAIKEEYQTRAERYFRLYQQNKAK